MANSITANNTDSSPIQPTMEQIAKFQARRRWAKVAWVYSSLLLVATVMLGTFVVAFLASLKDDHSSSLLSLALHRFSQATGAQPMTSASKVTMPQCSAVLRRAQTLISP